MLDITLLSYAVAQLSGWQWLKWVVCIIITMVLARALAKQNMRHATLIAEQGQNQLALALFYLAKSRGMVALGLWTLLCVLMIYRDIEMEIDRVKNGGHSNAGHITAAVPAPPTPVVPAVKATPEVIPEASTDSTEKQLDSIKASYEDAFVSYLILDGCKQSNIHDYEALYLALLGALKPFDTTGKEAGNIIIAASGSYQGLYRGAPCIDSYLTPVKQNFAKFMQNARKD